MHTIFETAGPIATLTFNRPEARNAMTWAMYEALVDACERVDRDAAIHVLVLRGAGGKAFVVGTDISQFQTFKDRQDGLKYEERLDNVLDRIDRAAAARRDAGVDLRHSNRAHARQLSVGCHLQPIAERARDWNAEGR